MIFGKNIGGKEADKRHILPKLTKMGNIGEIRVGKKIFVGHEMM